MIGKEEALLEIKNLLNESLHDDFWFRRIVVFVNDCYDKHLITALEMMKIHKIIISSLPESNHVL